MSHTFEEAYDRLSCPHASSCNYYQESWSVTGTPAKNKLVVEVECRNCHMGDHLQFNVGSFSRSLGITKVGETFEVTEYISEVQASEGDTVTVRAIADNPLYESENVNISIVRNLESDSLYQVAFVSPKRFEMLLDKGKIERA